MGRVLRDLQLSKKVDLRAERIIFAVLFPITSRGESSSLDQCPINLKKFVQSLKMDDLARYRLLEVSDFPLRFISPLTRIGLDWFCRTKAYKMSLPLHSWIGLERVCSPGLV